MNSFMFTFSAEQASIQLSLPQNHQYPPALTFRRRLSSPNESKQQKYQQSSSEENQLFENSRVTNESLEESYENELNIFRMKNSSVQLQDKRKLRTIIDSMLGKNFDMENNTKLDSIIFTNRKNLTKQRSYLTGSKKNEQKSRDINDNDCKQNQIDNDNIFIENNLDKLQSCPKPKSNLKLRKFQFAAIKINKLNSQRYREKQYELENEIPSPVLINKRSINMSRDSVDRQSLGKKLLKNRTPKIMYPQSDSKLPSVFRTKNSRANVGQSAKKRTRILSAHHLADTQDKIIQDEKTTIQRKQTLENPCVLNNQVYKRSNFRPKSTMLDNKRYSSQHNDQIYTPSQFCPKKLVFDNNQQLGQVRNKISSVYVQNIKSNNVAIRISKRTKSTHASYINRKIKDIPQAQKQQYLLLPDQSQQLVKNISNQSKQTAQESTLQSSMDEILSPKISEKLVQSFQLKLNELGCSVTFQAIKD